MIFIPGSLSFAKLVMKSSAPVNSAGDARYAAQDPFIHSNNNNNNNQLYLLRVAHISNNWKTSDPQ